MADELCPAAGDQCGQKRAADCDLSVVAMTNALHQTWDAEFQESRTIL